MSVLQAIKDLFKHGCIHDWQIVESKSKHEVCQAIQRKLDGNTRGFGTIDRSSTILENRICLKCGLREEQIDDYAFKYLTDLKAKKERQEYALKLWDKPIEEPQEDFKRPLPPPPPRSIKQ